MVSIAANGIIVTIEEGLKRTKFGKFNYLLIILSGVLLNNIILEAIGISFALPVLKCDLDLTAEQQGALGAVAFLGIIASAFIWGYLADTLGRSRVIRPSLFIGFFMTVLSSLAPSFEILIVLRFLNGFFVSAGSAIIFAYLGEFHSEDYRNRAILAAAFISAFSAIFFPVIAWIFINQSWQFYIPLLNIVFKPWRLYVLVCGIPGFLCGIAFCFFPESPKFLLTAGHKEQALKVLKTIYRINMKGVKNHDDQMIHNIVALHPDTEKNNATDDCKKTLLKSIWQQTAPLFMRQHLRKTLLVSLLQFVILFSAHGVYMWFPYVLNLTMIFTQNNSEQRLPLCDVLKIAQNLSHIDNNSNSTIVLSTPRCTMELETSTFYHTILLEIIYVALLLVVCYAIKKIGRQLMLFLILALTGISGCISLIVQIPIGAIYIFIIYLCCGLGTIVVNAIVVDIYPTNLRAMAVCVSLMLGRIGSVTGSNIMGILIDNYCVISISLASISLILAGFLGFLLPKTNEQTNEDENIDKSNENKI